MSVTSLNIKKEQLIKEINYHDQLYWEKNSPEISDENYDNLVKQLRDIDPHHKLVEKINTPKLKNSKKIKHETPMLSLDKAYTTNELLEWCKKRARDENEKFLIEPKLDGWAAKYINKKLITRGDGFIGDDITSKIPLIAVKSLNYEGPLKEYNECMIGEILLSNHMFNTLNTNYKTSRSALQGILGRDNLLYDFECLDFISYDYISKNTMQFELKQFDEIDWEQAFDYFKKLDWAVDGIVIKLKDKKYSESLGCTGHHPRGQIALKSENPKGYSIVKNIEFFVGKGNTITPVAIVEPVEILGHTIQKASLHNYKELKRLDVHIGDTVTIERCGEIIPQIKKCEPGKDRKKVIIENCPVCNSDVKEEGFFLYCINKNCPGSLSKRLADSCKRIGIENIGPAIVDNLVDLGIKYFYEIFEMDKQFISKISNFKQKSIDNLYNEIQKIKTNPIEDWKILASLNISNIGRSMSKKLLKKNDIYELINMELGQLENLENIGPERSILLYEGLRNNDNLDYFLDNFEIVDSKNDEKEIKICFTGKMDKPRSYYQNLAESKGLTFVKTITKDLNVLVAADVNSNSSKLIKAKKLGIKIISTDQFLKI